MRRTLTRLLYTLPILFLTFFYAYPLLAILRVSFGDGAGLGNVAVLLGTLGVWQVVWFTTWQAALSTLLTVLAGLPLAYVFATYEFPGKTLVHALLTIPFVMPTVVVAAAFTALIGHNGVLNQLLQAWLGLDAPPIRLEQTIWLILLVHVFYNVAVIIRTVGGFWSNLNPHLAESAAALGGSPWTVFRTVTLPLLLPSVLAASLLVFLFCFTSFGVILILGGLRFATIEVEIYRQAVSYFNLPAAAVLAILQLIVTFTVMVFYTRLQSRVSRPLQARARRRARRPVTRRQWGVVMLALVATGVGLLAPLGALAVRSLTVGSDGVTFAYYAALGENLRQSAFFVPPIEAVRNSLFFAGATLLVSLPLGIIGAYMLAQERSRWAAIFDPLLLLPLGTSAVTLGFGYIVAMGPLRTSLWLVPVAHSLIALPFVVRTFLPALRALDVRLREAAATLGAGPVRSWWTVDVPLLMRAVLISAAFAFAISLGEFGATLLIARPDRPTMPMVIYQALSRPGLLNYGQAMAMSTILMVVSGVALMAIEQFRLPGAEEF